MNVLFNLHQATSFFARVVDTVDRLFHRLLCLTELIRAIEIKCSNQSTFSLKLRCDRILPTVPLVYAHCVLNAEIIKINIANTLATLLAPRAG